MPKHPPILPAHRVAPPWDTMTAEQQNAHWERVWNYYGAYEGDNETHPDRIALADVLRLNTPPVLLQKYEG